MDDFIDRAINQLEEHDQNTTERWIDEWFVKW